MSQDALVRNRYWGVNSFWVYIESSNSIVL